MTLSVGERFVLRVGQAGADDDRFAKFVAIAFDEQAPREEPRRMRPWLTWRMSFV